MERLHFNLPAHPLLAGHPGGGKEWWDRAYQEMKSALEAERVVRGAASRDVTEQGPGEPEESEPATVERDRRTADVWAVSSPNESQDMKPDMGSSSMEKPANEGIESPVDFLLIAALEEERDALLSKLPGARRLDRDGSDTHTYYDARIATRRQDRAAYRVILTMLSEMGPIKAAIKAGAVIKRWSPAHVLMVGIGGGIEGEVALGDAMVATRIADYTVGKVHPAAGREERWVVHEADANLLDAAANFSTGWEDLITHSRPGPGSPKRVLGVMASGGDVIASKKLIATYRADWPKLIGVDMEGGGVAAGLHDDMARPRFLMIRGVSDLANGSNNGEAKRVWRSHACDVAAAYAIGLLRDGPVKVTGGAPRDTPLGSAPVAAAPRPSPETGMADWRGFANAPPTYEVSAFDDVVLCMHPIAQKEWQDVVPNATKAALGCVVVHTPDGAWHRESIDPAMWRRVFDGVNAALQEVRFARAKRIHLLVKAPMSLGALIGARIDPQSHGLVVYQHDNKEGSKDQKIWRPWGPAWPVDPRSRTEPFFEPPPGLGQLRLDEDGDFALVVNISGNGDPTSCVRGVRARNPNRPVRPLLINARVTGQGAIRSPADADKASAELRQMFQEIAETLPNATLHLFYYGPLAVLIRASSGLGFRRTPIIVYESVAPPGQPFQWVPAVEFPEGKLLIGGPEGVAAAGQQRRQPAEDRGSEHAPPLQDPGPVNIFVIHAEADSAVVERLEKKPIGAPWDFWHQGRVGLGELKETMTDRWLSAARIVIVVVSRDLLGDERANALLQRADEARRAGRQRLIPLLARRCDVKSHPVLAGLQTLPKNDRWLEDRGSTKLWLEVDAAIRKLVEEVLAGAPAKPSL